MDAMKKAIMNRRMRLSGMEDFDQIKDANMNPAEGSTDDLEIAKKMDAKQDGLAPETGAMDNSGEIEVEQEQEVASPIQGDDQEERINSFFSKDDVNKPGIRGKAAAKMLAALKSLGMKS